MIKRNIKILMGFLITFLVGVIGVVLIESDIISYDSRIIFELIYYVGMIGTLSTGISLCRLYLKE